MAPAAAGVPGSCCLGPRAARGCAVCTPAAEGWQTSKDERAVPEPGGIFEQQRRPPPPPLHAPFAYRCCILFCWMPFFYEKVSGRELDEIEEEENPAAVAAAASHRSSASSSNAAPCASACQHCSQHQEQLHCSDFGNEDHRAIFWSRKQGIYFAYKWRSDSLEDCRGMRRRGAACLPCRDALWLVFLFI